MVLVYFSSIRWVYSSLGCKHKLIKCYPSTDFSQSYTASLKFKTEGNTAIKDFKK